MAISIGVESYIKARLIDKGQCAYCDEDTLVECIEGDSHKSICLDKTLWHWDSELGFEGQEANYCFSCGRKL